MTAFTMVHNEKTGKIEMEFGLPWPKLNFPRGATHCDGPTCCYSRGRRPPGSGSEVARPEGDSQGTVRWFCSSECESARMDRKKK